MVDLTKLPIYDPNPAETIRKSRDLLIGQGRAARRAGFPVTKCPPFKYNDMAISWKMGWRWEDEAMKRKQRRE